jgi:cysteine desulfurase/selenocysteine lyase
MATNPKNAMLTPRYDVERIRQDFPILSEQVYDKPLVYFDSAASAQKPRAVIDAISNVYETQYANVHRGVHYMSQKATDAMEESRESVRTFINAADVREIIFVRGATEGINLVAHCWGRQNLSAGDEIIVSVMEHHSNIVPWQMIADQTGAVLKVIPIGDDGALDMDAYADLMSDKTKIVAITHISNALGTITPIAEIIRIAHERGVPVLVDGCQAAPHVALDMQALGADFYVFSGHKIYGPSGIGVLYGKAALLETMPSHSRKQLMPICRSSLKRGHLIYPGLSVWAPPSNTSTALGSRILQLMKMIYWPMAQKN